MVYLGGSGFPVPGPPFPSAETRHPPKPLAAAGAFGRRGWDLSVEIYGLTPSRNSWRPNLIPMSGKGWRLGLISGRLHGKANECGAEIGIQASACTAWRPDSAPLDSALIARNCSLPARLSAARVTYSESNREFRIASAGRANALLCRHHEPEHASAVEQVEPRP
jgi:hypothetical protein